MGDFLDDREQRYQDIMSKYYEEHPQFNSECNPEMTRLVEKAARNASYEDDGWGGPIDG